MKNKFDVIVIGAGAGGLNIAGFMNTAGFKVLLIDKSDENIGGDCLNTGCIPSKSLLHFSKTKHFYKDANFDIKQATDYIKDKQNIIREHENAEYFRNKGITVVFGEAKFADRNSVVVGDEIYTSKKIVLATGSKPRYINIPGIENVNIFNNENIFNISYLPKKLIIIGGGPIGVELGQAFNNLGSNVTILTHRFLHKEDKEVVSILRKKLEGEGIKIYTNIKIEKIVKSKCSDFESGKIAEIIYTDEKEVENKIETDAVLFSAGRTLNIKNLDLEKAGIELENVETELDENKKLKIDNKFRTTNKNVVAIGDVAGNFMFTHAAELHASVIINNYFSPFKKKFNGDKMSWVTYTSPEIATFGLSENELKKRNIKHKILRKNLSEDDRSIVDENDGLLKVFVSPKGKVLGGTMVSKNAGELIQELILLNSEDMKIDVLANKIYPYPTATRINRSIALSFLSEKLTPKTKKVLKFLFKILG